MPLQLRVAPSMAADENAFYPRGWIEATDTATAGGTPRRSALAGGRAARLYQSRHL
ncbi:MAG TPA: hypothetical protein VF015_09235 [Acidimicrobiales bacterium]